MKGAMATDQTKLIWLAAFITLQILDVVTTLRFIDSGHGIEANPVIALAILHFGAWWWVAKLAATFSIVPILARGRVRYVAGLTAFYAFTVVNNALL